MDAYIAAIFIIVFAMAGGFIIFLLAATSSGWGTPRYIDVIANVGVGIMLISLVALIVWFLWPVIIPAWQLAWG